MNKSSIPIKCPVETRPDTTKRLPKKNLQEGRSKLGAIPKDKDHLSKGTVQHLVKKNQDNIQKRAIPKEKKKCEQKQVFHHDRVLKVKNYSILKTKKRRLSTVNEYNEEVPKEESILFGIRKSPKYYSNLGPREVKTLQDEHSSHEERKDILRRMEISLVIKMKCDKSTQTESTHLERSHLLNLAREINRHHTEWKALHSAHLKELEAFFSKF